MYKVQMYVYVYVYTCKKIRKRKWMNQSWSKKTCFDCGERHGDGEAGAAAEENGFTQVNLRRK